MPEKIERHVEHNWFCDAMDGQVPRNIPGFFARPLEFCAFESDFGVLGGIEKLIAFHMLVETDKRSMCPS